MAAPVASETVKNQEKVLAPELARKKLKVVEFYKDEEEEEKFEAHELSDANGSIVDWQVLEPTDVT